MAFKALDDAHQPTWRLKSDVILGPRFGGTANRHEVGDGDATTRGREGRAQNIRARKIRPFGSHLSRWTDREKGPLGRIEQTPEHRHSIKATQTAPVDRTVTGNERSAVAITDYCVIADGPVIGAVSIIVFG
nr:hypothetical protein [Nitrosococcus wardiae]